MSETLNIDAGEVPSGRCWSRVVGVRNVGERSALCVPGRRAQRGLVMRRQAAEVAESSSKGIIAPRPRAFSRGRAVQFSAREP